MSRDRVAPLFRNQIKNISMIQNEKDVLEYLRLPSIPKKQWDKKSSFTKGVAILQLVYEGQTYAVATFDREKDVTPRIVKVFSQERFTVVGDIFVVPEYMEVGDIRNADLDDESKKNAERLAEEAKEIEDEGTEAESHLPENEYYFDHIHSDEEAAAYIAAYNKSNKIRGRVPKTHEGLVMRLSVIYAETNKS